MNRTRFVLLLLAAALIFGIGGFFVGRESLRAELPLLVNVPVATMNPVIYTPGGMETMSANIRNALETQEATLSADG